MIRSSNPALSDKVFQGLPIPGTADEAMTIRGTVNKTAFLLIFLVLSAGFVWAQFIGTRDFSGLWPYLL
ncbi:MAG: Bax inhibitor-1/YccA family protein, partial [Planctomycetota bacterium]